MVLTTLLPFLFLKGPVLSIINKSGSGTLLNLRGLFQISGDSVPELVSKPVFLQTVLILIPLVSAIALSLFRNRKLQMKFTILLMILSVTLTGIIIYHIINLTTGDQLSLIPGYRMFLPLLILLFSFLAYRGISKDDNLVKSYDRLR